MRNTVEYETYLTNPLEDRYPEEVTPTCDECSEPHDEQPWCGECGCCRDCCKGEDVDCFPSSMKYGTLIIHLYVDEKENPDKWNIAEMFDGVKVSSWKWEIY